MQPISARNIKDLSEKIFSSVVAWRREIHQHPELAFEEEKTSLLVCRVLEELDIPYTSGIAKTGVMGIIKGKYPEKKCIALRADMDALPIQEKTNTHYASRISGCMHACGHDFHTASLLGTAYVLQQIRDRFAGTIKLIFQPSEEKIPGGASVLIERGVLQNPTVDLIRGQHVSPELSTGQVGFKSGPFMASADEIYITITGKGGHAAFPHQTVDPIPIAAEIILALQKLISRMKDPFSPAVLSFGKIAGGAATNIIPDQVELCGTFRAMDEEFRVYAHNQIQQVTQSIANAYGAKADINILKGYPYLHNDESLTERCIEASGKFMLKDTDVIDIPMRMSAEDFAFYGQKIPACFYRMGTGNTEKGIIHGVHTPFFDVDEDAFKISVGLMAWLAISAL